MAQNNQVSIKPRTNAEWAAERRIEEIYSHGNREGYAKNCIDPSVRIRGSNILREAFEHTPHFSFGRINESNFSQVRNYTAQQNGPASMNSAKSIAKEASRMGQSNYKNEDEYGMLTTLDGDDDDEFAEFDSSKHGDHALDEYVKQSKEKQSMTGRYGDMDKDLIPRGAQASRGSKVKSESWRDPYVHQLLEAGRIEGMMDTARAMGKRALDSRVGKAVSDSRAGKAIGDAVDRVKNSEKLSKAKTYGSTQLDKAKEYGSTQLGKVKDHLTTTEMVPEHKKTRLSNRGKALVGAAGLGVAGVGAAGAYHLSKKQESYASDYAEELKRMSPSERKAAAENASTLGKHLSPEEAYHHSSATRASAEQAAEEAVKKRASSEQRKRLQYLDEISNNGEHYSPGGAAVEEVAGRFKNAKVAGKGMSALLALGFGANEIKKAYDAYRDRHDEEPSHEELHHELTKSRK